MGGRIWSNHQAQSLQHLKMKSGDDTWGPLGRAIVARLPSCPPSASGAQLNPRAPLRYCERPCLAHPLPSIRGRAHARPACLYYVHFLQVPIYDKW